MTGPRPPKMVRLRHLEGLEGCSSFGAIDQIKKQQAGESGLEKRNEACSARNQIARFNHVCRIHCRKACQSICRSVKIGSSDQAIAGARATSKELLASREISHEQMAHDQISHDQIVHGWIVRANQAHQPEEMADNSCGRTYFGQPNPADTGPARHACP